MLRKSLLCFCALVTLLAFSISMTVAATPTVDQLSAQKAQLEKQAKQAEEQAKLQKSVAERAAERVQKVAGQINQLQGTIQSTQQKIQETQTQIGEKNQEIAQLEADLRRTKDQQDVLVREIYIRRMTLPDELIVFSNQPVSAREVEQQQYQALKKFLASVYSVTNSKKLAVEGARTELQNRSKELASLETQQEQQKIGLADVKLEQAQLRENAEAAVLSLEAKAKQARAEEAKIENQISAALTAAIKARAAGGGALSGAGVGQRVHRGEIVGHEGSTGYSTGPHVHFEVRLNNTPVNPQPYVNNGTLRWPISDFVISQGFGYTDYASSGAYGGSIHTGIDLAGPYGSPVYAPADGTVILNQYYGGYGNAWAQQLDNGLVVLLGHMTGK